LLTTGAQIALHVPVLGFVVKDGTVGTIGRAGATSVTYIIQDDHHAPVIENHRLAGTGQKTVGFIAVFADDDVELVFGHVLGDKQASQTQIAFPLVVKGAS
jgi:hypothetical protein